MCSFEKISKKITQTQCFELFEMFLFNQAKFFDSSSAGVSSVTI